MRIAIHDFGGHPFVFELSRQLARMGHDVGHFYFGDYPGPKGEGRLLPDDPSGLSIHDVRIKRAYSTQAMGRRLTGNLAYAAELRKAIKAFRPDIILSGNTPTEVQEVLLSAARGMDARFLFWMQDFYSLAVSSLLRGRWGGIGTVAGSVYRWADRRQLRRSDGVVIISDGFRGTVEEMTSGGTPIWTIPNWGAINDIPVCAKDNPWARREQLTDRTVVLYSGTLGLKHNPDLLVKLARALEKNKDAMVLVAAQGAGRTRLEAELAQRAQPNLRLLDLQPITDFPDMLGTADVVVALLEEDAGRFSVPSKVLSYLCAARPVVLSAPPDNLASIIVRESNGGIAVAGHDGDGFVAAVIGLCANAERRSACGVAGRAYAEAHFRIDRVAARFAQIFEQVLRGVDMGEEPQGTDRLPLAKSLTNADG